MKSKPRHGAEEIPVSRLEAEIAFQVPLASLQRLSDWMDAELLILEARFADWTAHNLDKPSRVVHPTVTDKPAEDPASSSGAGA